MNGEVEGLSLSEHITRAGCFNTIKDRAAMLEKREKEIINDLMDGGESRNIMIDGQYAGKLEKTKGSQGDRFKVKDKLAYGVWLYQNGYADDVYSVPMPSEVALTKGFIDRVVGKAGGELPDGVEVDGGRPSTVRISMDKQFKENLFEQSEIPSARLLLDNGGEL